MSQANAKSFRDPRVQQLFNRYATYNGSDPYKAPATLNVIPHLEHNLGAFYPAGGMYSVAKALHQLAQEMGVVLHFNEPVKRIQVAGKCVRGILTEKGTYEAPLVVSNVDIYYTFKHLLPDQQAPTRILKQPRSSSALIFYWGMKAQFPELEVHNLFFSNDYPKEFEALHDHKTVCDDPTVYVYISSKESPSHAPPEGENWFTMINVPHISGQDWDQLIAAARQNILKKLSKRLGKDLAPLIQMEKVWDPRGIERDTFSWLGALYGNSSNNKFAAFLRHPNFSRRIKGLYFAGGSVHPGGGVPLCLLSAKIIQDLLTSDSNKT